MHWPKGNLQPSLADPSHADVLHSAAPKAADEQTRVLRLDEILSEAEHPLWPAAGLVRLRQSMDTAANQAGSGGQAGSSPVEPLSPVPPPQARVPSLLALQSRLFQTLVEEAPQMIWHADPQGGLLYANPRWYALTGASPDSCLGTKWLALVHPEDRDDQLDNWQRCRLARRPYSGVRRIRAGDGSYHTMSCKAMPVLDERGDVAFWVGIDADISEARATEEALRLSNQELLAFSYSVSHDLRSPLGVIDGYSRLLAKQLGPQASDQVQHYLTRIEVGVAQMGQLIEDLLSLAQVSGAEFRHDTVPLSALATQVLERHLGSEHGREVRLQITPGLQARGDARLLRVVLENLLGNAWKFTARCPCTEISVGQFSDAEDQPIFFVRDNGVGFDMADADRLFKTCQRLHSGAEFAGTGIGLATVHRIVTRHGGQVWADSEPGKGATFFFTLPD